MAFEQIESYIELDLYDYASTPAMINAIALDNNARSVTALICERGRPYNIGQNANVVLTIMRPDKTGAQLAGQTHIITGKSSVDPNTTIYGVYAELTQSALSEKGSVKAQFKITSGNQVLRTEIFTISTGQALDADITEWTDYQGYNLDELIQSVTDLSSDVTEIQGDVSELKSGFNKLTTATAEDVGKVLKAKTVTDGKVTEWEFGEAGGSVETDKTLTESDVPADAKAVGDLLRPLFDDEIVKTTVTTPNVVASGKIIQSSGNIADSAYTDLKIWVIPLDGTYKGVGFHVIKGVGVLGMAYYNADTYEECDSTTFISLVNYPNDTDNEYDFVDGAKMLLINFRSFNSGYLYTTTKVKKADAVVDAESAVDFTNEDQIYRLGDNLYYWNGEEWATIGSGEGGIDSEVLNLLVEDVTTKDYFVASDYKVDTKKKINADGSISEETTYNPVIYAFPANDYQGIAFHTIKGPRGTYVAFYTATDYAGCNANTFISAVNYPNDTDCVYDFPEGAKMCLLNSRGDVVGNWYYYVTEKVSKADAEINDFRTELNTEIGSTMTVADLGTFVRGRLNVETGAIITSAYQCISAEDIIIDRTIQISFDNDIYSVTVYYNNGDDTYSSNGGQNTEFGRTIVKGSKVRFNIVKRGSTVALTDGELVTLPQALTFNTALEDWKEYVNDNCDYEAVCAKMFEKGGSEKSFSNAVGILAAGQSNINGRVPNSSLPSDIVPPFANIKNSINSKTGTFNNSMSLGSTWGVDFSLYDALNKLGQDFYVVKWSEGGTSISPYGTGTDKWTPFYEELDNISKSLLWSFETQIRACLANNPNTFNPRAMIWHQGEGDFSGNSKKAALAYYKNFKCLIAYIRGIVGNERLPIIYGTISHNSGQYCPIVEEAQLKFASEDPYAYCIDMSGASLIDSYHFDADACVYFGRMAYDALIDFGVITGTKINPTRPW